MKKEVRKPFKSDDRGAVAATYALSLFALIAVAGIAFDYARLAGMDSELQNGADQAALAGATQLAKIDGSCARATNAAIALLNNETLLANEKGERGVLINGGTTITVADDACTGTTGIVFYEDKEKTDVATTDETANFIHVTVDARIAQYAFTPVVGALNSGNIEARAMAGLGSAVCKVPPIMVCHPDPNTNVDWDAAAGDGILATGHSPGNSSNQGGNAGSSGGASTWSPGNFGFLQVEKGDYTSTNAALLAALAYNNPTVECTPVGENKVSTGTPQGLYDAINTRFGIYDFPSNNNGGGNVLASCEGGNCSPAPNIIMDYIDDVPNGNSAPNCKLANGNGAGKGYTFPTTSFAPTYKAGASDTVNTIYDTRANVTMGMPRDLCHYQTYSEGNTESVVVGTDSTYADGLCPGGSGRFGDGKWARNDYWGKVHPAATKPTTGGGAAKNWFEMTRYETYLYEIANGLGRASQCGLPAGDESRRVMTIAIVTNCDELNGTSQEVDIDEFVDVFLVEPSTDNAGRYNAFKDSIYVEIIGRSKIAGSGVFGSQEVRRDVPYLVE